MNPQPTGRLIKTASGADLVLIRTFGADIHDVSSSPLPNFNDYYPAQKGYFVGQASA